jgi:hypothetical protein
VQLRCDLVHPSRGEAGAAGGLDFAALHGFARLTRLRPGTAWPVGRFAAQSAPGQLMALSSRGPLDPAAAAEHGAPLLAEFCSRPIPRMRFDPDAQGGVDAFVIGEGVGTSAASTVFLGEWVEGVGTKWAEPSRPHGRVAQFCSTPCEVLVMDHAVHRSLFGALEPELLVVCELGRRVPFPQNKSEPALLTVPERARAMGRGLHAFACADLPEYPRMVARACAARGWDPEEFDVYRVRMEWPPIPSTVVMRYRLPEKPGAGA